MQRALAAAAVITAALLVAGAAGGRAPALRPNGRIVFAASVPGSNGLRLLAAPVGKGRQRVIGRGGSGFLYPTPSPDGRLIAFVRDRVGSSDVWTMRQDGKQQRRIAEGSYPTWSPDGRELAFVSGAGLMTVRRDGTGLRDTASGPFAPLWSPTGNWIAFATFDDLLWAVHPDGSDVHQVAPSYVFGPGFGRAQANYDWSPDGKRLAFVAIANGADIFTAAVEGGTPTQLTGVSNEEEFPRWSPDGSQIAFWRSDEGTFVVPAGGGAARVVTRGFAPTWSPTGLLLAVLRGSQVYVVRRDGTGLRRITRGASDSAFSPPVWMPNGKEILIARPSPYLPTELYTIAPGVGPRHRVTHNGIKETEPAWSPDGRMIAFTGVIDPRQRAEQEIFVVRADGTHLRRVTRHPGEDALPSWSPDGKWIVFERTTGLYVVSLEKGRIRPVGGAGQGAHAPAWSPNGRWIAVDGVRLVSPGGRAGPTITHPPENGDFNPDSDLHPDWSPGGGRIAFIRVHWVCPRCDEYSFWIADSTRANPHKIADSAFDARWSPDGKRLAVATYDGIVTMRPDGSGIGLVAGSRSAEAGFDWGPAAK